MTLLEQIIAILAGMTALGAAISALVNVLKAVGLVKDGDAEKWVQGFNLVAFLGVTIFVILGKPVLWDTLNEYLEVAVVILGYLIQILGSKLAYPLLKGTPLIGYSHEQQPKG